MRRIWQWTSLLALSALIKPVVLPVAAFILKGQHWKAWTLSLATGAVVCGAVAAPLLSASSPSAPEPAKRSRTLASTTASPSVPERTPVAAPHNSTSPTMNLNQR